RATCSARIWPPKCSPVAWRSPGKQAATSQAGIASMTPNLNTAWRAPGRGDPPRLRRVWRGPPRGPPGLPPPRGRGILNAMHKATGEVSEVAIEVMTTLNADASRAALHAGLRCATVVTGFGLLGHAFKLARASGVSAVIDHRAVPVMDGVRAAQRAGHLPGGSRRNLAWVAPHAEFSGLPDEVLLLLADAQTSGGLLIAGEIPGAPVIGQLVPRGDCVIRVT